MSNWQLQDAKAKFSELVDKTLAEGPQVITRRGVEAVVVVPVDEWKRLKATSKPTLKELLLAPHPKWDVDKYMPGRGKLKHRRPVEFE